MESQVETFYCNGCKVSLPVLYRDDGPLPYGWEPPVCTMCTDYWDYLAGPWDEEDEEGYA